MNPPSDPKTRFRTAPSSPWKRRALAACALPVLAGAPLPDTAARAAGEPGFPPEVDAAEVRSLIDRAPATHPRLLVRPGDWEALPGRVAGDARLREIAEAVRRDAEAMLEAAPVERKLEGRRLLGESRRAVRRLLALAMAHRLTGESSFADRAEREMLAIAGFSDWNPAHYLDVAEMTFAMAVGYDWLFDRLDGAARATVRDAILEKGVRVPLGGKNSGWTRATNNWGQVCHAGMVAGALAVLEDDREAAALTVARAIENVPRSMAAFAPKGSYPEGPGYWSYGTTYNVLLIGALESALGTSFSLDRAPGFAETGAYPALTTGPSGLTFNYADGGAGRGVEPAVHWFAARYRRPSWLAGEDREMKKRLSERPEGTSGSDRFFPLLLLPSFQSPRGNEAAPAPADLPLHWTSESEVPVAVHRSSWTEANAVFVGLKAGSPSGPHGHMDIGSFVMDADGVRWAADLGAESYHRIESREMSFWSMKQDSDRWRVFRQSSLSHNTLVIGGALQRADGRAAIVRFSEAADFPHTVVDMGAVYAGQVSGAQRGVALLPSGEVLVRDRLTGLKAGAPVRWAMATPATAGDAGRDTLELRQGKATLAMRILRPAGASWTVLDLAKPKNEWDSPNRGMAMVAFTAEAPASGTLDLAVVLTPGSRAAAPPEQIPLQPPLEWSEARVANPGQPR